MTRASASDIRPYKTARAALCAAGLVAVALVAPGFVGSSRADEAPPAFTGSAAASGIRMTMKSTNIPLTDTPAEGGGPTAQVVVETAGTSQGYAAVPDPGPIVIGGPAIAAGILGGGVPGVLPPTQVPQPPGYPFYVQSDTTTAPEQTFGSGPVQMSASSSPGTSKASASAGLQSPGAVNAGLATSKAEIAPAGATVVAKAVSRTEGLTVGPLTIGAVTSVATETLDASGKLTPSTELQVDGVVINGQSIGLSPEGFGGGGSTTPVPLNPALESVLKESGISIRFVAPQTYENRVVAPALEVTMPFDSTEIPGGQYKGTMTLRMGFATAAMTPAGGFTNPVTEPIGDTFSPVDSEPTGGVADVSAAPTVGASSEDMMTSAGYGGVLVPSFGADSAGTYGSATLSAAPSAPETIPEAPTTAGPSEAATGRFMTGSLASARLDVRGIYLIGVLTAVIALAGGEAVRRFGRST